MAEICPMLGRYETVRLAGGGSNQSVAYGNIF